MLKTKQQVQEVLDQLPDDCTLEDVQYHLYVADLIRRRVEMSEQGDGIPHDTIVKRFAKWRTESSGSPRPRKTSRKSPTTSAKRRKRTPTA
jgi:hypothetical protein